LHRHALALKTPAARGTGDGKHKGHAVDDHLHLGGQTGHGGQLVHQVLRAVGGQAPAVAIIVGGQGQVGKRHRIHARQQVRGEVVDLHIGRQ